MNEAIVLSERHQEELEVATVVARKRKILEAMQAVMIDGTHYGTIPGTPKPTLYQPGAELICTLFRLAPEFDAEDISVHDEVRYRVRCELRHVPTAEPVGQGCGEASTSEEKYRWKAATCDEEWDETPEDRRRAKWKKGAGKKPAYQIKQIRTEPADLANTVLKMACKRAMIAAVRTATAASDVFAQDLDELAAAGIELGEDAPDVAEPKAKPAPRPARQQQRAAAPKESEPAGDGEPGAYTFAAEAWQRAADNWHDKGAISEKQGKRLYAIAYGQGWSNDTIAQALSDNLDCTVDELPWGQTYEAVVSVFETYGPEDMADPQVDPEPAGDPADDEPAVTADEIPF